MKNYYILIVFLFSVGLGFSQTKDSLSLEEQQIREQNIQAGNPFKQFGYKPKISTLSNGKYLEFHDLDSIVQIGSFTFHIKKKMITGYIVKETKYSEATLRPEIVSRWFSPDPLAEEFSDWSPYVFTNDNPIFFIDPTGLAPMSFDNDYGFDKVTGELALIKKTDDENDVIYSGSFEKDGNFKKDGKSIAIEKGALFGEENQNLAEEGIIFRNLGDGLKTMKFLSFNAEIEFSGWGFSDSGNNNGLFMNPWESNTFRNAKDMLLQTGDRVGLLGSLGTKKFKIHTHPSSKSKLGFGYASPSDMRNVQYNPTKPHYILSRHHGITRYNRSNTYTVGDLDKYF